MNNKLYMFFKGVRSEPKKFAVSLIYKLVRFVIIFGLGFIICKPLIGKILFSFMDPNDIFNVTVQSIPSHLSLYYWKYALNNIGLPTSLINTVVLSVAVASIQTAACTLVGYGFARFKFAGRNILFAFVIILMLVPLQTISIAQYQTFAAMRLVDTFIPLYILAFTCMGLKQGLYIYLIRDNFMSIPNSIEEAACIDGAGIWTTFFRVMLPNAKVIMITSFLFSFCWQWSDTQYTSLYLKETQIFANVLNTLYVRVGNGINYQASFYAKCAAVLFMIIPLFCLFAVCQRFFVKSIAQSGLSNV